MSDRVTEAQLAEWEALAPLAASAVIPYIPEKDRQRAVDVAIEALPALIASHRAVLRDRERVESSRKARLAAIRDAVDETCSCGGLGPDDDGVCDACKVWHRFSYIMEDWSKLAAVRSIGGEG